MSLAIQLALVARRKSYTKEIKDGGAHIYVKNKVDSSTSSSLNYIYQRVTGNGKIKQLPDFDIIETVAPHHG